MQLDFNEKIKKLEKIFGIEIKNHELFQKALTHSSYTGDNKLSPLDNYQRLEFFGDAVLKLCVSEILFKKFPDYQEGDLTKIRTIIVSDSLLSEVAQKIGLDKLIIFGKQGKKISTSGKNTIAACVFEAVLGAYYIEGKFNEISKFLEKIFKKSIKEVDEHFEKFNAKAILQEHIQSLEGKLPNYNIVEEVGPEHDKIFIVEVSYLEEILASGEGKTKRAAEQECAYKACVKLGVIK